MHSTKHKTGRVTKKELHHPFDSLVAMRGEIEEAAVERKALMKTIADFIKVVLLSHRKYLYRKASYPSSVLRLFNI